MKPSDLEQLDSEELGDLLGTIISLTLRRFSTPSPAASPTPTDALTSAPDGDTPSMVGVKDASGRLGMSKSWLYRNAPKLPFATRPNGHNWRFSVRGMEKYLRESRSA